jgi:hypothetical protein
MNTSNTSSPWVPYSIPPCPVVQDEIYGLSFTDEATPTKNPSQFLEWKKLLPKGKDNDILIWEEDEWVPFSPSGSEEEPNFLKYDGSELSWGPAELPEGENLGDLLYWNPAAGDEGEWDILSAPTNNGAIIYWVNGSGWNFINPPSGGTEPYERFLYWNTSSDSWQFAEVKEFDICENGQPKTYKIPAIPVP